ncbi:amidophosphoribosyltransferase [Synechococcus sp. PCC 7336]|uniref:amidophosphoribosyltransferase n=1 Tax=Synechococcus sp. PCC 7336 TaxID=195250 RepID=UPI0003479AB7|nr:amidophosphoribosyltransferase [Synechococcus sp. PCC 7336]
MNTLPTSAERLDVEMEVDKPQEACGVFGILAPAEEVAKLTYFGLFALQHRGQESAGISVFDERGNCDTHKGMGLVSQVFDELHFSRLQGVMAIGHTRYSTTGSSREANAQPVVVETRLGSVAIAHNGNLVNASQLRDELIRDKRNLVSSTDSEGIAHAIAQAVDEGADWVDGMLQALARCQGAFSLTVGTPAGLAGVRDPYGVRPLVIGLLPHGDIEAGQPVAGPQYVLASETCALDIIGAEFVRSVEPGELVWIANGGLTSYRLAAATPKLCVFEMIYFARPDSEVHDESLYAYRTRLGELLAREAPAEVDFVVAVPDSGRPAAIGYANELHIPYMDGLIKNHYVGRTFIQPTQAMRERGIRMKLNPLKDVLRGQRIVLVDDSIVRGTTSRKIVKALRNAGAREVHMRISSPPVTHPCFYGIDTDSQDHLIAANYSVREIEQHIGVDSLEYLSWEGMLAATGRDPDSFCSACFTGDYPIAVPDPLKRRKLMLETV